MELIPASAGVQRFSTDMFSPRERISAWREFIGRKWFRVEIEPRLRERHAGAGQGLPIPDVETQCPGYLDAGRRPPGFEPSRDAAARAIPGLVDLAARCPGGSALATYRSQAQPTVVQEDGFCLAYSGHPQLRSGAPGADGTSLARWLRQRGPAGLAQVGGDFALAFWDAGTRSGAIAIDRIGVHQLVYTGLDGGLLFASNLDALAAHPAVRRELSPQALFEDLGIQQIDLDGGDVIENRADTAVMCRGQPVDHGG